MASDLRTRAALAQVKQRGEKRLGNPTNLTEAQRKGAAKMKEAADTFAARMLPDPRHSEAWCAIIALHR